MMERITLYVNDVTLGDLRHVVAAYPQLRISNINSRFVDFSVDLKRCLPYDPVSDDERGAHRAVQTLRNHGVSEDAIPQAVLSLANEAERKYAANRAIMDAENERVLAELERMEKQIAELVERAREESAS